MRGGWFFECSYRSPCKSAHPEWLGFACHAKSGCTAGGASEMQTGDSRGAETMSRRLPVGHLIRPSGTDTLQLEPATSSARPNSADRRLIGGGAAHRLSPSISVPPRGRATGRRRWWSWPRRRPGHRPGNGVFFAWWPCPCLWHAGFNFRAGRSHLLQAASCSWPRPPGRVRIRTPYTSLM